MGLTNSNEYSVDNCSEGMTEASMREQVEKVDLIFSNPSYENLSDDEKLSVLEEFLNKSKELFSYNELLRDDVAESLQSIPDKLRNHQALFTPELMSFKTDLFPKIYSDYYLKPRAFVDTKELTKDQVCFIEALEYFVMVYHKRGTIINFRALWPVLLGTLGRLSIDNYEETYGRLSPAYRYLPEDYAGAYIALNVLSLEVTLTLLKFIEDTDLDTLPSLESFSAIYHFVAEGWGNNGNLTEDSKYFLCKAEEIFEKREGPFLGEIFEYFTGNESLYETPEEAQKALFLDEESLNMEDSLIYFLIGDYHNSMSHPVWIGKPVERLVRLFVLLLSIGETLSEAISEVNEDNLDKYSPYGMAYSALYYELESVRTSLEAFRVDMEGK